MRIINLFFAGILLTVIYIVIAGLWVRDKAVDLVKAKRRRA